MKTLELENTKKDLRMFQEMLYHTLEIPMWSFRPDGELMETNCTDEEDFLIFLREGNCLEYALSPERDKDTPVLCCDPIGLLYLGDYFKIEKEAGSGEEFVLVMAGPFFSYEYSWRGIEEILRQIPLSLAAKRRMLRRVKTVPRIDLKETKHLSAMLHFMLEKEGIKGKPYQRQTDSLWKKPSECGRRTHSEETLTKARRYNNANLEDLLLYAVETGDVNFDFEEAICKPETGNTYLLKAKRRPEKNTLIVFNGLCSRAAVKGGLPRSRAMDMEVHYMNQIEQCETMSELLYLYRTMFYDYIHQVHSCQKHPEVSPVIRDCCDYIHKNLLESISLGEAAACVGYTDYYLSRKFKQEMGISFHAYVKRKRMELAKIWLRSTDKSIQEISEELHFSTRSYFSKVFAEATGVSPALYRERKQLEGENAL